MKESSISLVGVGLLAGCVQSYILMAVRMCILVSFLTMSLGIDGTDQPTYGVVVLHSRLEQRSVPGGLWAGDYAQMVPEVLYRCMSFDSTNRESKLTLYNPVFNLTKGRSVSVTEFVVQRNGSLCLDGKETERKSELANETVYLRDNTSYPMPSGERYFVNSKYGL